MADFLVVFSDLGVHAAVVFSLMTLGWLSVPFLFAVCSCLIIRCWCVVLFIDVVFGLCFFFVWFYCLLVWCLRLDLNYQMLFCLTEF